MNVPDIIMVCVHGITVHVTDHFPQQNGGQYQLFSCKQSFSSKVSYYYWSDAKMQFTVNYVKVFHTKIIFRST